MSDLIDLLIAALADPAGITSDYDLNPGFEPLVTTKLRPAAVLVPIWRRPEGIQVVLTKRASHLKHHPGQIAFPGGKVDKGDADVFATALREAHEEIGLYPCAVNISGLLPAHETVTGFHISPVLGLVRDDFQPVVERGEVEEVFTVPLEHVLQIKNYTIEGRNWMGQRRAYYAVPYGPYYIWGATARILRGLAERMTP